MLSPDWLSAEMKVHVLMFGDSGGLEAEFRLCKCFYTLSDTDEGPCLCRFVVPR